MLNFNIYLYVYINTTDNHFDKYHQLCFGNSLETTGKLQEVPGSRLQIDWPPSRDCAEVREKSTLVRAFKMFIATHRNYSTGVQNVLLHCSPSLRGF